MHAMYLDGLFALGILVFCSLLGLVAYFEHKNGD